MSRVRDKGKGKRKPVGRARKRVASGLATTRTRGGRTRDMTQRRFWSIIEASRKAAGGVNTDAEQERFLAGLRGRLKRLSLDQLRAFCRTQEGLHQAAYRYDLWEAALLLRNGVCSDDGFIDFRFWLMAQGRKVWQEALNCPDTLADHVVPGCWYAFESLGFVAANVFEEATGRSLWDDPEAQVTRPLRPTGTCGEGKFPRLEEACRE